LLIGGKGADQLVGNGGDDLLIGGTTSYDADAFGLSAVMAEWTSGRDYATRVANLRGTGGGPRANGTYFLITTGPNATVGDEGAADDPTGAGGMAWFFGGLSAAPHDRHNGEELN